MDTPADPHPPRRIVFVATDDGDFASRYLPVVVGAAGAGHEVAVVTQVREHRPEIEAAGGRVVPLAFGGASPNPVGAGYAAGQLAGILKALRADLVHAVAPRGVLVGGTAAAMAGVPRRVFALAGLGPVAGRADPIGRLARLGLATSMRALATPRTRYLFEDPDDPRRLGLDPGDPRVTVLGGTGSEADAAAVARVHAELLAS